MDWIYLIAISLVFWGLCGAVMMIGRKMWSIETALLVHLAAAPVLAFALSAAHAVAAPTFDPLIRAAVMTGTIIVLDAGLVAPVFERSYAMFRSVQGTWLPFLFSFLASWAAGYLMAMG